MTLFHCNPNKNPSDITFTATRKIKIALQFSLLALFFFSSATGSSQPSVPLKAAHTHHLTVLFTNDTHGHPVKFSNLSTPDVGGLPARATLVGEIRNSRENVLLLDAGDLNTGQPVSNFFKAEPDILGYNYLAYDAMVLGNHEFDNGINILKGQMNLAKFPFLSANVKTRNGDPLGVPYIIKQFKGFRVAVFGLTTTETRITGNPDHIKDLIFEDEVTVAKRLVPYLKKRADLIIALTHLGIYDGPNRGSKRLATKVGGIDLIVDGNTDTKLDAPLVISGPDSQHETLIVQAWHWGLVLGKIDLWFESGGITSFDMELIPVNLKRVVKTGSGQKTFPYMGKPISEDPELLALLQPYSDKVDRLLNEKIGYANGDFQNENGRTRETALGDLVADAMRWYLRRFKPDFALTNSGAIRAGIPEGPVTRKAVYNTLPFDSSVVFLRLSGPQVQALFRFIGTIEPGEGAFPQVSKGIRFTMDPVKKTCENILVNGQPVDPDKSYNIVTNSYLAKGGDGYAPFVNAIDRFDSSTFQRDALVAYIEQFKEKLVPKINGRIKLAP